MCYSLDLGPCKDVLYNHHLPFNSIGLLWISYWPSNILPVTVVSLRSLCLRKWLLWLFFRFFTTFFVFIFVVITMCFCYFSRWLLRRISSDSNRTQKIVTSAGIELPCFQGLCLNLFMSIGASLPPPTRGLCRFQLHIWNKLWNLRNTMRLLFAGMTWNLIPYHNN